MTAQPATGTGHSRCSGPRCGAIVRWVLTEAGRRMPLDEDPHPDGTVVLRHGPDGAVRAHVLTGAELPAQETAWRPHWQTCPDSSQLRRRKAAAAKRCRTCGCGMDPWLPAHGYGAHIGCLPVDGEVVA